jgi:hypothetical protein
MKWIPVPLQVQIDRVTERFLLVKENSQKPRTRKGRQENKQAQIDRCQYVDFSFKINYPLNQK